MALSEDTAWLLQTDENGNITLHCAHVTIRNGKPHIAVVCDCTDSPVALKMAKGSVAAIEIVQKERRSRWN